MCSRVINIKAAFQTVFNLVKYQGGCSRLWNLGRGGRIGSNENLVSHLHSKGVREIPLFKLYPYKYQSCERGPMYECRPIPQFCLNILLRSNFCKHIPYRLSDNQLDVVRLRHTTRCKLHGCTQFTKVPGA